MEAEEARRFGELFSRVERRLEVFVAFQLGRTLGQTESPEDVVAEVAVRLLERWSSRGVPSFPEFEKAAWWTARNVIWNLRRRAARRATRPAGDLLQDGIAQTPWTRAAGDACARWPAPAEEPLRAAKAWAARVLTGVLEEEGFPALRALLLEKRRRSEIAGAWGVTRAAVSRRVRRESRRLRVRLKALLGEEGYEVLEEVIARSPGFANWLPFPADPGEEDEGARGGERAGRLPGLGSRGAGETGRRGDGGFLRLPLDAVATGACALTRARKAAWRLGKAGMRNTQVNFAWLAASISTEEGPGRGPPGLRRRQGD